MSDEQQQQLQSLQQLVKQQQQQIDTLKQRLKNLGHDPNIKITEEKASDLVSNLTGDHAISLAFPALLRGLTTKEDVYNVQNMCQLIVSNDDENWKLLFKAFFDIIVSTIEKIPHKVQRFQQQLNSNWFREPWYLMYPQWTGIDQKDKQNGSDFDSLRSFLPYIRYTLGFKNICLLPHYESPMADNGYDVSSFHTRKSLGSDEAFLRFMNDALDLDIRIATEAIFNHVSTEHQWFQNAISGQTKYINYFIQRNGREKIAEWDRQGDIICKYRDPDGTITERVVVFPDIDRTHGLWVEINGKTYQFYRQFFPFQVDLDLQNPHVLIEIFHILSKEIQQGIIGKRMDAIAHWIKKPGSSSEGLPQCHTIQALLKCFLKHLNSKAIIIPEVIREIENASTYAGIKTEINGQLCSSEGDAILAFEMQAALKEMTYFQTVAPFWRRVFRAHEMINSTTWLNILEHHDETYMGFFEIEVRRWLSEYIKTHGGLVYKNGMSAGGRYADGLNHNSSRIATAIFITYLAPGTPMMYAGTEIGTKSNWKHGENQMKRSKQLFEKLGVYATEQACFDPRELQRGPLLRSDFEKAVQSNYEPLFLVQRLNELWETKTWLKHDCIMKPVDSGDVSIFCMGRSTTDESVVCMANLTPLEKFVYIPMRQVVEFLSLPQGIREDTDLKLIDVLKNETVNVTCNGVSLKTRLSPFTRIILKDTI